MIFVFSTAWDTEKILSPHEELNLRPSESLFHTVEKTKFIFLYFFTELKTYHLSNFNVICDTSSRIILNIHAAMKVREMAVETVQLLL